VTGRTRSDTELAVGAVVTAIACPVAFFVVAGVASGVPEFGGIVYIAGAAVFLGPVFLAALAVLGTSVLLHRPAEGTPFDWFVWVVLGVASCGVLLYGGRTLVLQVGVVSGDLSYLLSGSLGVLLPEGLVLLGIAGLLVCAFALVPRRHSSSVDDDAGRAMAGDRRY
jgi:hypothetical protein